VSVISDPPAEYVALTTGAGLLDRSERGKLALTGADTKAFLHGQVTQDITALSPGHGVYAALLTNKGKMLADLRVLDTGDELALDTERAGLQELFNTIRRFSIGYDVEMHKRTLQHGLLSLIGPRSDAILRAAVAADIELPGATEHDHVTGQISHVRVRIIRTDLGLDLLMEADQVDPVRSELIDAGAVPVSEATADTVRIESGRPRFGIDLDDTVIPQEAGLNERAVSFTKGCYVGQETVARLFYRGKPNRELRGLSSEARLASGTELSYEGRMVATVTSAAESPRFGPIALAFVRREAPVGARLESGDGVSAVVVELPFA
jgi:folate-binding protein YgfZ